MNSDHIRIIRESFAAVARRPDVTALLFYKRLFELDPALRPLFRPDLEEQGHKLMEVLGAAVRLLEHPEALSPVLEALGRRHVGYGVKEPHYDTVGAALLRTLSDALGDAFTPTAHEAWSGFYSLIAGTMKRAAAVAEPRTAPPMRPPASHPPDAPSCPMRPQFNPDPGGPTSMTCTAAAIPGRPELTRSMRESWKV